MPRETNAAKRERAIEVCERLNRRYGPVECFLDHENPFRLLIAVLLSAQTTDAQVNKVTPKLFTQWPTPEAMAGASVADVADTIKSLGFYKSKAKHAVEAAQMIVADYGGEVPADMKELVKLPGVGRKTANIVLAIAAERGEAPLLVLCDEISDPHNLGAIIRTAECVGAHGVIIPKRRSAGLTAVVDKTSAGALEHMAVARVPNLAAAIETLKKNGLWIYGTAAEGANELWKTDLTGPACIVIGSEGAGISRLVREKCDFLVSIPLRGQISSLNASAAAAVLLYEALRQRS